MAANNDIRITNNGNSNTMVFRAVVALMLESFNHQ